MSPSELKSKLENIIISTTYPLIKQSSLEDEYLDVANELLSSKVEEESCSSRRSSCESKSFCGIDRMSKQRGKKKGRRRYFKCCSVA